jgi:uncharacterized membrane protein
MTLKIAQFINLALVVLVAGAMWGTWLGLSRSMGSFSADTYLDIGHAMIGNLAPIMPVLMLSAVGSAISVVVLLYRERSTGFLFTIAGLVLLLVVILITVLVEVPINNQTRLWTPTSLPADWKEVRDRWALFHLIRTFTSLAALGLFLGATVFGPAPLQPTRPQ